MISEKIPKGRLRGGTGLEVLPSWGERLPLFLCSASRGFCGGTCLFSRQGGFVLGCGDTKVYEGGEEGRESGGDGNTAGGCVQATVMPLWRV